MVLLDEVMTKDVEEDDDDDDYGDGEDDEMSEVEDRIYDLINAKYFNSINLPTNQSFQILI